MKKLIVTIICVLFASTSFAQMVGASSIAKQSTPKTTLGVKKHEFSIHGGYGFIEEFYFGEYSIGLKYKYKPFKIFDIRLLLEVEGEFSKVEGGFYDYECQIFPTLPILAGLNYEYRFNNISSAFMDLGLGINIPLDDYKVNRRWSEYVECYDIDEMKIEIGQAISLELGYVYKDFIFSFKVTYTENRVRTTSYWTDDLTDVDNHERVVSNSIHTFRLGYRF